jgi:hypothetical protein
MSNEFESVWLEAIMANRGINRAFFLFKLQVL